MIVTRRRLRKSPINRIALGALLIGAIVGAFFWPPSRDAILKRTPAGPNQTAAISQLQTQVSELQKQSTAKDTTIAQLQDQLASVQRPISVAKPPPLRPSPDPNTEARTAQYWSAMEPENAAKIVEKLPPIYVKRIFALMSPDAAAQILDLLPTAYATQISLNRR